MMHNRMMLPNSPTSPTITVAQLASIGIPYAFNIWTVYGRIARMPVNCDNRKMDMTNKNGFSVRLRISSRILSMIVGAGCGHFTFCLMHTLHELDRSLYRWSDLNSCSTPLGDTQPRSHCNDFNASSVRFFDSSHNGVSGTCGWIECIEIAKALSTQLTLTLTKQTAIMVVTGIVRHARAAVRQGIKLPIRKMMKKPRVAAIDAHEIRIPRMDGSLKCIRRI